MRCPSCKNKILQKSGDRVRVRIKGAVTLEDDLCKAACYWCGKPVAIPLQLKPDTQVERETFVLRTP